MGIKEVTLFYYRDWPQLGVPTRPQDLLAYHKSVKAYQENHRGGPLLVTCSDATGSTGSFIALDTIIKKIESGEPLESIYNTIKGLRRYHQFIQNSAQLKFIFKTLHRYVSANIQERIASYDRSHLQQRPQPILRAHTLNTEHLQQKPQPILRAHTLNTESTPRANIQAITPSHTSHLQQRPQPVPRVRTLKTESTPRANIQVIISSDTSHLQQKPKPILRAHTLNTESTPRNTLKPRPNETKKESSAAMLVENPTTKEPLHWTLALDPTAKIARLQKAFTDGNLTYREGGVYVTPDSKSFSEVFRS
jgi:hypothetical protein